MQHLDNMLTDAVDADSGLLVINAAHGCYEDSIKSTGMSYLGPLALYTGGTKQLIVVVNKMDDATVEFSEVRFNLIKSEMTSQLKK